jgi:hypothetical protein
MSSTGTSSRESIARVLLIHPFSSRDRAFRPERVML